jgi:PhzF family phenazine biosynthesis protein
MRQRPFKQVDVFTATPYYGNPLAVVLDGSDLTTDEMQQFAQWTNLSETTFVLPPSDTAMQAGAAKADYRVRIFTPGGELPFAGHPTLGSCHAWLQAGGQPQDSSRIVQECQIGLVHIRRDGARLAFAAPPLKRSAPSPALLAQVAGALGLKPSQIIAAQMLDNGPVWLGLLLDSPQTVRQLTPNHAELKNFRLKVGVASMYRTSSATGLIARSNREARAFGARAGGPQSAKAGAPVGTDTDQHAQDAADTTAPELEVRAFAAPIGVNEDPVTGSLNASLAQWLIAEGHAPERYIAAQGTCLGRAGRVHIERDAQGQVWVGGESVTCVEGTVTL